MKGLVLNNPVCCIKFISSYFIPRVHNELTCVMVWVCSNVISCLCLCCSLALSSSVFLRLISLSCLTCVCRQCFPDLFPRLSHFISWFLYSSSFWDFPWTCLFVAWTLDFSFILIKLAIGFFFGVTF